jgi:hypothetical protein
MRFIKHFPLKFIYNFLLRKEMKCLENEPNVPALPCNVFMKYRLYAQAKHIRSQSLRWSRLLYLCSCMLLDCFHIGFLCFPFLHLALLVFCLNVLYLWFPCSYVPLTLLFALSQQGLVAVYSIIEWFYAPVGHYSWFLLLVSSSLCLLVLNVAAQL